MIELLIEDERGNVISHQLGEGRHTLGKAPTSDIVLMDSYASRYHADIIVARKGVFVIDADSRNGIRFKNKKVKKTFKVEEGEDFYIGKLKLSTRGLRFNISVKDGRKPSIDDMDTVELSEVDSGNIDEQVSKLLQL